MPTAKFTVKQASRHIDRKIAFIKSRSGGIEVKIAVLAGKTSHKALAIWACDCAERVLPYFEKVYPEDKRPRLAIEAGRAWARTGVFHMAEIRKASLDAHAAARYAKDACQDAACFAARAAGHAAATAHVDAHAFGAADYAIKAVAAVDLTKAKKEREWQYRHLIELKKQT